MPQMQQKKTPRKANIQTQEDELAQNVPDVTPTVKSEPAPKRAKQSRKPRTTKKEAKKPKAASQRGRKDSGTAGTSSKAGGKSRANGRTASAAKKAAAASSSSSTAAAAAASGAADMPEPSVAELLSKYVRHRPAVCNMFFNIDDPMRSWKKKGVPGHFEKPSDVRIKKKSPSFDDIVGDEHFETRRTVDADARKRMLVAQFQSILIDDLATAEHAASVTSKLKEETKKIEDQLSEDDSAQVAASVEQLNALEEEAREQRSALQKCMSTFTKVADSQQRSISAMINKHAPRRAHR